MSERSGNGDIDIMIAIYPHTPSEKGNKYDRSISRQVSVSDLSSLTEMYRVASSMAPAVVATITAMLDTLAEREMAEVAASQVVQVEDGEPECVIIEEAASVR